MQLLIEHGADLEVEVPWFGSLLSVASNYENIEAVKLLLDHGADVNQRQKHGQTVLFTAIKTRQIKLTELLLACGADVNVFADRIDKHGRLNGAIDAYSPLQASLMSFKSISRSVLDGLKDVEEATAQFAAQLAILKLLVPRCDSFDLVVMCFGLSMYRLLPCVVHFFLAELEVGSDGDDDFTATKYLLRNGAVAKFSLFWECTFEWNASFKPLTTSLFKLIVLAGCKFDKNFTTTVRTKGRGYRHQSKLFWYDAHIQAVLDKVEDLFSQPLTLQELSIMAIRQCIGSRQLWAKIDSLPDIPRSVKDMIQLKSYSPDKN